MLQGLFPRQVAVPHISSSGYGNSMNSRQGGVLRLGEPPGLRVWRFFVYQSRLQSQGLGLKCGFLSHWVC